MGVSDGWRAWRWRQRGGRAVLGLALMAGVVSGPSAAADRRDALVPCRLSGVEQGALCGQLQRPLDPARPDGVTIAVHFAVVPALSRNRKPDPVFFFAGGPGQSAIELGGPISRTLSRLSNRRDLVLIDQRGTGQSAPLVCPALPVTAPLAQALDAERQLQRLQQCRAQLQALPHGDLRHYTTWVAMQDVEAVRVRLGAAQINLVGGSYGTRAALEYQRQFPDRVRRLVLDGVAPPDAVLPASFSTDAQAAWDQMLQACESEPACSAAFPRLRADWQAVLASLPKAVQVAHPVSGRLQSITLKRGDVLALVRVPLYLPALAAGLPAAVTEAAAGRWEALTGLFSALGSASRRGRLADGMHFSVLCSEDWPRLARVTDPPGRDFGDEMLQRYRPVCTDWPRGEVPAAFFAVSRSQAPALLFSGGADPATPPRHGQRVADALGPMARHVVVPQAGHGVLALPCVRDIVFRFLDAEEARDALGVDVACAVRVPRPPAFIGPAEAAVEAAR